MASSMGITNVEYDREMATLRSSLFKSAMRGSNREAYGAQITKSCDTALHLAVCDGQEDIAVEIVNIMSSHPEEAKKALNISNDNENTILHIAAAVGSARMCYFIAKVDPYLVGARNEEGETPLFWATQFGKTDAFLCLHSICGPDQVRSYYRKKDGETILHVAIGGEFFDLAFQIIVLYEELVNSRDQEGITSLHLLATKPNAFRSRAHLKGYYRILYHCVFVDEPKVKEVPDQPAVASTISNKDNKPAYAESYETCMNFFQLPKAIVEFGSTEIQNLQEKKEKHTWSVQIMGELLQRVVMYEYENMVEKNPHSEISSDELPYTFVESGEVKHNTRAWDNQPHTTDRDTKTNIENENKGKDSKVSAILIAAKNGLTEMVEKILKKYPVAIHDMNLEKKNIVLLAVEHRQPHIFELQLKRKAMRDSIFRKVDDNGNSALHLAAMLGDSKPWSIPGAALQMQWEFKWYEKCSMLKTPFPTTFSSIATRRTRPQRTYSHQDLVKNGGEWLTHTSESCKVVAALIATAAFATSATVPGGVENNGKTTLQKHPAFSIQHVCYIISCGSLFLSNFSDHVSFHTDI
ncbi:ankyrin repeat-containing protein, putative [Ricinus communis]|uniref:Ankyrin repeat-containing protein, putative n=1 Tax=Ricinus communis TaxID=3988 RepID=B9S4N0_RICCO|nr:ankyrin repeat-containing protein, putative [Ricinus communis]